MAGAAFPIWQVRAQLAALEAFGRDEKYPKQLELLDAVADATTALAGRQLQRPGPNPKAKAEAAALDELQASWAGMEKAEGAPRESNTHPPPGCAGGGRRVPLADPLPPSP